MTNLLEELDDLKRDLVMIEQDALRCKCVRSVKALRLLHVQTRRQIALYKRHVLNERPKTN